MPIYDRFINNRILLYTRRPHPQKYCAPTTVGEILDILINKHIPTHDIAKQLDWPHTKIISGSYGTDAIIAGVTNLSENKIKHRILKCQDTELCWNELKNFIKSDNGLLFYHEKGHHVLLCGYSTECIISSNNVWDHSHMGKEGYENQRHWLFKSEHNIKTADNIRDGIIVQVDFREVCKSLHKYPHTNLVYFYT